MPTVLETPDTHEAGLVARAGREGKPSRKGRLSLEARLGIAFAGALVMVVLLAAAVFDMARRALDGSRWVAETQAAIEELDTVLGGLGRVEAAVLGYALTADEAYLGERDHALSQIESRHQRLGQFFAGNPLQHGRWIRLRQLLDERLARLDRMILIRQTEGGGAAARYGEWAFPRESMHSIRAALIEMQGEERRLLDERARKEETQRAVAVGSGLISAAVFALFFALAYFAIRRQLSERREAEQRIEELNRDLAVRAQQLEAANKELEGFSYSVSHDLRAPLRAIAGFSKMLQEDHASQIDEEAQRKLGVIQSEAQRMGVLIDELLTFSRLGRKDMKLAAIDMTELARATYRSLDGQHGGPSGELRLATLPGAHGDRVLLGQVWANLLSNALKFSSKRERPLIEVGATSNGKENTYFVRDNGAGFDPRYQSKLFGVFQRLHHASEFPGTGVGLALVQRIVVRHGGRVWADSKPGEGATFYFTLPTEESHGAV